MKKVDIPFLRSQFNYDAGEASIDSGLLCTEPTLTVQSSLEEVDINTIVKRFNLTGQLPDNIRVPQYGDFDSIIDYHTALNAVAAANEQFDRLPADIRKRFQNDPGAFVDFCVDPKNLEELRTLGLASKAVQTTVAETQQEPKKGDKDPKKGESVT